MVSRTDSLATVVLEHAACAQVFQRRRLDFCCDGHQTVEDAARRGALDVEALMLELEQTVAQADDSGAVDLRALTTRELVQRAVSLHHLPLRRTVPLVQALTEQTHGLSDRLPTIIDALAAALLPHLEDESQVMFPALLSSTDRARTADLIALAERDHRAIVARLFELRDVAGDYVAPAGASVTARTLLNELLWLETDVLALIHLETHVLQARFRDPEPRP